MNKSSTGTDTSHCSLTIDEPAQLSSDIVETGKLTQKTSTMM